MEPNSILPIRKFKVRGTVVKSVELTILALLVLAFDTATVSAKSVKATRNRVSEGYGKLPLHFEANRGQTDGQVRFLSRDRGQTLYLTRAEAVLTLPSGRTRKTASLWIKLLEANPEVRVIGSRELPGKSNYFIGSEPSKWRTNVPQYAAVKYEGVYPGIDLVFYHNERELEFDFVIGPGGDPGAIKLAVEGASEMELESTGNLLLLISGEAVRLRKPVIYQELDGVRKEMAGSYRLSPQSRIDDPQSAIVGFQVAAYDTGRPLIIDPVLEYSTYLGGNSVDAGTGLAVDSEGNAYVTGQTLSSDFPSTPESFNSGLTDLFVAKLNSDGSALLYATYLGGTSGEVPGRSIAVDSEGNAYVTGRTLSTDFPTTPGVFNALPGCRFTHCFGDVFVTKLNATGSEILYSTYLGDGEGAAIAVNPADGNAYITGTTQGDWPITDGALQSVIGGPAFCAISPCAKEAFVSRLNAEGSALVYSTFLGGGGQDQGTGIAVDGAGNAYVTGFTGSSDFPLAGALQSNPGGSQDAFVAKLNPGGSGLVYSTYLGGSAFDQGNGIAVDASGNAYVAGTTRSANFPTENPIQSSLGGNADVILAKLNAAGSALDYSTYLGGSGEDFGNGIALDASGNAYVTGSTGSSDFPVLRPFQEALHGGGFLGSDAFVAKINPLGSALAYSSYLGGRGDDGGAGIAVDAQGNAYVTGSTSSDDFPATVGVFQSAFNCPLPAGPCLGDAFVSKIAGSPPVADAGADRQIIVQQGLPVMLDGTKSSDPDGDSLSFQWTQISGPPVELAAGDTATPTFAAPDVGSDGATLVFELVVSDGILNSAPDTVTIAVINPGDAACAAASEIQALINNPGTPAKTVKSLQTALTSANRACALLGNPDFLGAFNEIKKAVSSLESAAKAGANVASIIGDLTDFVRLVTSIKIGEAVSKVCASEKNVRSAQKNFNLGLTASKASLAITRFITALKNAVTGISARVDVTGSWAGTLKGKQGRQSANIPILANFVHSGTHVTGNFQEFFSAGSGNLTGTMCALALVELNLEFGDGATGSGTVNKTAHRLTLKLSGTISGEPFTATGTLTKQ
ncbi:MAG: SBBP repeat-containing protein [Deltaproteobacteria bacterium]|nr:SBBP repeat-containing protein [Deltaproteobacteria bacterium]